MAITRSIDLIVDWDAEEAEAEIIDTRYPDNYGMAARKLTDDEIEDLDEEERAEGLYSVLDNSLDGGAGTRHLTFQAALSAMIASIAETLDTSLINDRDLVEQALADVEAR